MSNFEFISHEEFHEDEYTKEIVYLCLEGKYRVAYVRKKTNSGGMFWSVPSVAASKGGKKEYYPAFLQDSNFLERDIKAFLDGRVWEQRNVSSQGVHIPNHTNPSPRSDFGWTVNLKDVEKPRSMSEVAMQDEMPF